MIATAENKGKRKKRGVCPLERLELSISVRVRSGKAGNSFLDMNFPLLRQGCGKASSLSFGSP
jgi:hypothetical protein